MALAQVVGSRRFWSLVGTFIGDPEVSQKG
jgi:hypothetical protein